MLNWILYTESWPEPRYSCFLCPCKPDGNKKTFLWDK